ncbi:hypothetical protein NHH03_06350 [Stieleria sp. TO1_6]|uniref:hypothetical protein n=1 Tax=Stieleria tagensis TaxID=2956795 RepID=UPI00209B9637|nr:hypothetical protein [Stieleria tagensis]MCO8121351.1 hypothetical protein [Stieleria tagensis]
MHPTCQMTPWLTGKKKMTVNRIVTNPIAVIILNHPKAGGMRPERIGSGQVTYGDLLNPVLKRIRASSGS